MTHPSPRSRSTGFARVLMAAMVALVLSSSLGPLAARAAEPAAPAAPEPTSPADGAVVEGLPLFTWDVTDAPADRPPTLRLEVAVDADFAQLAAAAETTDLTYQQPQELDRTLAYRWRVGLVGEDGQPVWSDVRGFTLAPLPTQEPAVVEPAAEPTLVATEPVLVETVAPEIVVTETPLPVEVLTEVATELATEPAVTEVVEAPVETVATAVDEPATEASPVATEAVTEVAAPTTDASPTATEADETVGGAADASASPTATATRTKAATKAATKTATRTPTPPTGRRVEAERVVIPPSRLSGSLAASPGLRVSGISHSSGSRTSAVVVDRNLATIWTSGATRPVEASVTVKLDRSRGIGRIRWMWGVSHRADRVRIEVSRDRVTWTRVATVENAPTGQWQSLSVDVHARYVRFRFENPNRDSWVGGLAEVEVYAVKRAATPSPVGSPTPVATPKPKPQSDGVITNASFERGTASWHVEDGAGVVDGVALGGDNAMRLLPGGGYAGQWVALDEEKVHELTGWGKLSSAHDVGQIGVVFFDRDGVRLRSLEPTMLAFTSTTFVAAKLRFAIPARVAKVVVTIYKATGGSRFYVDDLSLRAVSGTVDPTKPTVGCQQLMLPGYFDPATGLWDQATSSGSGLGIAVFNPESGPGFTYSAAYAERIAAARAAGITPFGYVYAKYGLRPIADVKADVDRFEAWYGITDIYLDNGATELDKLDYFRTVMAHIHQGGGLALVNFGWAPNPAYMEFTDIANIYEDSGAVYEDNYERPAWINNYPATRFSHQIYNTPADRMDEVVALSRERNAAYVWISDDNGETLYKNLPTYWDRINRAVRTGC